MNRFHYKVSIKMCLQTKPAAFDYFMIRRKFEDHFKAAMHHKRPKYLYPQSLSSMKQPFGKSFILIPIGLFFISAALASLVMMQTSDFLTGIVIGTGIGLAFLPFLIKKIKTNSY